MTEARAEQVARASHGRLLALLAADTSDIAGAEDALGDAFLEAVRRWPQTGVPDNPEAWLFTVARNRQRDRYKSAAHRLSDPLDLAAGQAHEPEYAEPDEVPDRRLGLMFVCAHPAIPADMHAPLILQTILGLDAATIASAFQLPPSALAQRLVRAKRRIKDAHIAFDVPDRAHARERLQGVLEAIYGAYAIDFPITARQCVRTSLAGESLYLATLVASMYPHEPEALGLASLISFSLARIQASRGSDGAYVPLDVQDPDQWDLPLIRRAEAYLRAAALRGTPGRFQLEAAVQSAHCARRTTGATDWVAIRLLHGELLRVNPTLGGHLAFAAATEHVDGPAAAMAYLAQLPLDRVDSLQPYWALVAHLHGRLEQSEAALSAYNKAISLTTDSPTREHLDRKARLLEQPNGGNTR